MVVSILSRETETQRRARLGLCEGDGKFCVFGVKVKYDFKGEKKHTFNIFRLGIVLINEYHDKT